MVFLSTRPQQPVAGQSRTAHQKRADQVQQQALHVETLPAAGNLYCHYSVDLLRVMVVCMRTGRVWASGVLAIPSREPRRTSLPPVIVGGACMLSFGHIIAMFTRDPPRERLAADLTAQPLGLRFTCAAHANSNVMAKPEWGP